MARSELGPFYEFGANTNHCCDTKSTVSHDEAEVLVEKKPSGSLDSVPTRMGRYRMQFNIIQMNAYAMSRPKGPPETESRTMKFFLEPPRPSKIDHLKQIFKPSEGQNNMK